jgi:hypothetical protein
MLGLAVGGCCGCTAAAGMVRRWPAVGLEKSSVETKLSCVFLFEMFSWRCDAEASDGVVLLLLPSHAVAHLFGELSRATSLDWTPVKGQGPA